MIPETYAGDPDVRRFLLALVMSNDDERRSDNIVAGVIRDLIARVESFERTTGETLGAFETGVKDRQEAFEAKLFDLYVDLRKDIHKSYSKLELDQRDHAYLHTVEKQEKENDKLLRAHRQFTLNLILAGIGFLIIVGFIVLGAIVLLRR